MAQVVTSLPSKGEALSSILHTAERKKKKKIDVLRSGGPGSHCPQILRDCNMTEGNTHY
jgi:hypothetical protein